MFIGNKKRSDMFVLLASTISCLSVYLSLHNCKNPLLPTLYIHRILHNMSFKLLKHTLFNGTPVCSVCLDAPKTWKQEIMGF